MAKKVNSKTPAKNKKSAAAATKKRRDKYFNQYFDISRENKIRTTRKDIAKLDIYARENKTSFKKAFNIYLSEKLENKERYISRKYGLDPIKAREVLNNYLAGTAETIKKAVAKVAGEIEQVKDHTTWLDFIDLCGESKNFMDYNNTLIEIKALGVFMSPAEIYNNRSVLRQYFMDHIAEVYESRGINPEYARVNYIVVISRKEYDNLLIGNSVKVSFDFSAATDKI